jgi:hypothetical protein
MKDDLRWLEISALVAAGDMPAAMPMLRDMVQSATGDDPASLRNATRAAYFLEDHAAAAATYERLETLPAKATQHLHDEIDRLEVQVAVAFAYQRLGRGADADRLLREAEAKITQRLTRSPLISPNVYFVLAQISALKGEPGRALIHLQRAVDEGWRQHWRPLAEPSLAALVKDPAFDAMMKGLSTRMELIRERIAFDESFDRGWRT